MTPHILAHHGNLDGPQPHQENQVAHLRRAVAAGFGVEFDINLDPDQERLVLAHDPAPYTRALDVASFLDTVWLGELHALNVKNLFTISQIAAELRQRRLLPNFVLFDFEPLTRDLKACRYLMRSLSEQGCRVAYRLSEREPHFDDYMKDRTIEWIWLDELSRSWAGERHVRGLVEAGKRVFFASPDLHGRIGVHALEKRWEQVASWGVSGICTDYPQALQQHLANSGVLRSSHGAHGRNGHSSNGVCNGLARRREVRPTNLGHSSTIPATASRQRSRSNGRLVALHS